MHHIWWLIFGLIGAAMVGVLRLSSPTLTLSFSLDHTFCYALPCPLLLLSSFTLSCSDVSPVYMPCFFSYKVGATFPLWGLLLAAVQDIFYYTDLQALRDASALTATRFIMLGINCLIGYTLQYYCIAQVGQRISTGTAQTR